MVVAFYHKEYPTWMEVCHRVAFSPNSPTGVADAARSPNRSAGDL